MPNCILGIIDFAGDIKLQTYLLTKWFINNKNNPPYSTDRPNASADVIVLFIVI